jgi:hypothetical protein
MKTASVNVTFLHVVILLEPPVQICLHRRFEARAHRCNSTGSCSFQTAIRKKRVAPVESTNVLVAAA